MRITWNSSVNISAYKNRFKETINKKEIKEDKRETELYDYLVSQKNDIDSNNDGRITYSEFVKSRLNITEYVEEADKELLSAARNGLDVRKALAKGADVNIKNFWGETVLMIASIKGHNEIVKLLIDAEADLNTRDQWDNTALIFATIMEQTETVKLLIDAGADLNAKTNLYSETALMLASGKGYTAIVKLLIDADADLNAKNKAGDTALMYAARKGDAEIEDLLRKAMDKSE
ncbi:ankyrin repeat domain-containing protein [Candidatus Margulisiibacteriota bacterium]